MAAPFIVLDGIDGCGKSTQAALLAEALRSGEGGEVLHLREPGSTSLGEGLRALLLAREHRPSAPVETLLFAAARRHMLDEIVAPALGRGAAVVCERFHAATFAYQGVAGGLDPDAVLELLAGWVGEPTPTLTVVLTLAPAEAARRRAGEPDRIEARPADYHRAVAEGFGRYVERVEDAVAVDATGTVEDVAARVLAEVRRVHV